MGSLSQITLEDELRCFSAQWGRDSMLVQGAGGNTSFKLGGRLWVKASGFDLADALDDDIFVEVAPRTGATMGHAQAGLRPSIESGLHAILPHAVVAHLHMVDVLAYAVRADGEAALAHLLTGLDWRWLPYCKPGAPLADEIEATVGQSCPDIIILGNHGVVFGGPDCRTIDRLIAIVRARLATPPRSATVDLTGIATLAARHGFELPRDPATHQLAFDAAGLRFAAAGSLYPDHVVFLGRGVGIWPERHAAMTVVPDLGVMMASGLAVQAHAMAACLAAIATRVAPDAPIHALSRAEEDELIDWDAEAYRRTLTATRWAARA